MVKPLDYYVHNSKSQVNPGAFIPERYAVISSRQLHLAVAHVAELHRGSGRSCHWTPYQPLCAAGRSEMPGTSTSGRYSTGRYSTPQFASISTQWPDICTRREENFRVACADSRFKREKRKKKKPFFTHPCQTREFPPVLSCMYPT